MEWVKYPIDADEEEDADIHSSYRDTLHDGMLKVFMGGDPEQKGMENFYFTGGFVRVYMPDFQKSWIDYFPYPKEECKKLFEQLDSDAMYPARGTLFGYEIPRDSTTFWRGGEVQTYTFGNKKHNPSEKIPSELEKFYEYIESLYDNPPENAVRAKTVFNFAVVNRYTSSCDSISGHADDEKEIIPDSEIASLSLGATRDFVITNKPAPWRKWLHKPVKMALENGDIIIMGGEFQKHFYHSVPKCRDKDKGAKRINITLRQFVRKNVINLIEEDAPVPNPDEQKGGQDMAERKMSQEEIDTLRSQQQTQQAYDKKYIAAKTKIIHEAEKAFREFKARIGEMKLDKGLANKKIETARLAFDREMRHFVSTLNDDPNAKMSLRTTGNALMDLRYTVFKAVAHFKNITPDNPDGANLNKDKLQAQLAEAIRRARALAADKAKVREELAEASLHARAAREIIDIEEKTFGEYKKKVEGLRLDQGTTKGILEMVRSGFESELQIYLNDARLVHSSQLKDIVSLATKKFRKALEQFDNDFPQQRDDEEDGKKENDNPAGGMQDGEIGGIGGGDEDNRIVLDDDPDSDYNPNPPTPPGVTPPPDEKEEDPPTPPPAPNPPANNFPHFTKYLYNTEGDGGVPGRPRLLHRGRVRGAAARYRHMAGQMLAYARWGEEQKRDEGDIVVRGNQALKNANVITDNQFTNRNRDIKKHVAFTMENGMDTQARYVQTMPRGIRPKNIRAKIIRYVRRASEPTPPNQPGAQLRLQPLPYGP